MNEFNLLKETIEQEINSDIKNYIQEKYGEFLDVSNTNNKKIKIIHESNGMYSIYENNKWKLSRNSEDNIFQVLHDLGIIEFIDENIGR